MLDIFDFDRKAVSLLRHIKYHQGKTLSEIFQIKKLRDKNNPQNTAVNICFCLENLYNQGYISNDSNFLLAPLKAPCNFEEFMLKSEPFYITAKGKKFLEDRFDRYWMWIIPTSISVLTLICSLLTFLFSFHG